MKKILISVFVLTFLLITAEAGFRPDGTIDHDALTNFLTAEHVDWAGAGTGTVHTDNYVENATHTGDVTGSGALTIDKTAISGQALVVAAVGDHVIVGDASDTDNLKKVTVQTIVDLAGGGGTPTLIEDADQNTFCNTETTADINTIQCSTAGTEALHIDATQQTGINMTPAALDGALQITNLAIADPALTIHAIASQSGNIMEVRDSAANVDMAITELGTLVVGSADGTMNTGSFTPRMKIDGANPAMVWSNAAGNDWIWNGNASNRFDLTYNSSIKLSAHNSGDFGFDIDTLWIDASADSVGFGATTTPDATVEIISAAAATVGFMVTGHATQSGDLVEIQANAGTTFLNVGSEGNVGIGIVAPQTRLEVSEASGTFGGAIGLGVTTSTVGFFYATAAGSQACDTTCPAEDANAGFGASSGVCHAAWTSAAAASTCATAAADQKCLCMGAN